MMTIKKLIIKYILNKYFKDWLIKKPYALQIGEWDDWHTKTKSEHPIKYWIQETVPDKFDSILRLHITWPIRDWYWKVMHRIHPKHQYNIIKPRTLQAGYYDCDTRILHAIMEEVTVFFETGCNYDAWRESSDDHMHAYNELEVVYNWWTQLWPHREEKDIWGADIPEYPTIPERWGFMAALNEKFKDEPCITKWSQIARIRMHNENDWDNLEDEMINRIVAIRKFMWH